MTGHLPYMESGGISAPAIFRFSQVYDSSLGSVPDRLNDQRWSGISLRRTFASSISGHGENPVLYMANGSASSSSSPPKNSCCSGNGSNDAAYFECSICFELAQDPIVTLCGHLFCWSCLYKWFRIHEPPECPVCKAVVQEGKLIPLYGRGKTPLDPRSKSVPGINVPIPNRPAAQRPETVHTRNPNQFPQHGFGFVGGLPMAASRFGNFTFSACFGGLLPALFNVHRFPDATTYGPAPGFSYGSSNPFHGGHGHGFPHSSTQGQEADSTLMILLVVIFLIVFLAFLFL